MSILLVARVVAGKQVHLKEFLWHCAPAATLSHCLFLFVRKLSAVFSEPGSCSNYVGCVRERVCGGEGVYGHEQCLFTPARIVAEQCSRSFHDVISHHFLERDLHVAISAPSASAGSTEIALANSKEIE